MVDQEILVTVVCTTFNQESYIGKALESFVSQQTKFSFEIIVHDDASTDNTQAIIRHYHQRYPNLIRPILQSENQYSKGCFKPAPFAASFARGRYLALCEGDDYWTDNRKLQLQVDAMQRHPQCSICFHPAVAFTSNGSKDVICNHSQNECIFDAKSIIRGEGGFCPTPSLMIKKSVFDTLPDWFYRDAPVGDYYIQIIASVPDGALYIEKPMAAYRVTLPGSWTALNEGNPLLMAGVLLRKIELCDVMDQYFGRRYTSAFKIMCCTHLIERTVLLFKVKEYGKAMGGLVILIRSPGYAAYTLGYILLNILKNPKKGIGWIRRYLMVKAQ